MKSNDFEKYLRDHKAPNTVSNYKSALNGNPLKRVLEQLGIKDSVYSVTDIETLKKIKESANNLPENDHKNITSAIQQYINFLSSQTSEKTNKIVHLIKENCSFQTIFFGAPGTGKSYKVNSILGEERKKCFAESSEIVKSNHYADVLSNKEYIDCSIWIIDNIRILEKKLTEFDSDDKRANPRHSALQAYIDFLKNYREENRELRTTFHPDYDYAQFVGAYKPKKELNDSTNKKEITYSFVPQVFAKAYAAAWRLQLSSEANKNVFLVIEEINRGNCAQIFGDIFQLLDRDGDGFSQYSIDADCDFAEWLETDDVGLKSVWDKYKETVGEGKLKLPPNLNILATMNTSDQSLFPMDSAFKRRFDWEYVPIKYAKDDSCDDSWNANLFKVVIDDDTSFNWLHFLKKINADIYKVTESEDKQMGEFFIKPKSDSKVISLDEFRSKVLFYLWDSVYKDEKGNADAEKIFHFNYPDKDGSVVTFQRLFADDFVQILKQMLKNLDEAYKDGDFKNYEIIA